MAGPDTWYDHDVMSNGTEAGTVDGGVGPWQRIYYPGSEIGTGNACGTSTITRVGVPTAGGFDVMPAPAGTLSGVKAVRFALGELRGGEPGYAEIALRVLNTPLDGVQHADVDCAETTGSDKSPISGTAGDNAWSTFIPMPACVYLNLLFDLEVDNPIAGGDGRVTYTLHGQNLSKNPQENVYYRMLYDNSNLAYVDLSATGSPKSSVLRRNPICSTYGCNPDDPGDTTYACLVWNLGTLQPGDEYTFTAQFDVGGVGDGVTVVYGRYNSNGSPTSVPPMPPVSYLTQAMTLTRDVATIQATLGTGAASVPANSDVVHGRAQQPGHGPGDHRQAGLHLAALLDEGGQHLPRRYDPDVHRRVQRDHLLRDRSRPLAGPANQLALSITAHVPTGAAGLNYVDLQVEASVNSFEPFETLFDDLAVIPVGAPRSAKPVLTCPIDNMDTAITGTTTEGSDRSASSQPVQRGTTPPTPRVDAHPTCSRQDWRYFGPLYGGLGSAPPRRPPASSRASSPTRATCRLRQCTDGLDNDGDGYIDFPADPGCDSPADSSEAPNNATYPATDECNDGLDNDGDGLIDMADPDCTCPVGLGAPTRSSAPTSRCSQCNDGCDNDDGDGQIDFPATTPAATRRTTAARSTRASRPTVAPRLLSSSTPRAR